MVQCEFVHETLVSIPNITEWEEGKNGVGGTLKKRRGEKGEKWVRIKAEEVCTAQT